MTVLLLLHAGYVSPNCKIFAQLIIVLISPFIAVLRNFVVLLLPMAYIFNEFISTNLVMTNANDEYLNLYVNVNRKSVQVFSQFTHNIECINTRPYFTTIISLIQTEKYKLFSISVKIRI